MILILFGFFLAVHPAADHQPEPVLEKGDIEKLLKTWPALEKDMKKFGMKMDTKSGSATIPEAVMAGNEYMSILKKHGWDENFWTKFTVVIQGYSFFQYKKGKKEADSSMSKSMEEIQKNPHLSPEMKKQLMANLKMVKGALEQSAGTLLKNINPSDLAFIKPNIKKIRKVLDKENISD